MVKLKKGNIINMASIGGVVRHSQPAGLLHHEIRGGRTDEIDGARSRRGRHSRQLHLSWSGGDAVRSRHA